MNKLALISLVLLVALAYSTKPSFLTQSETASGDCPFGLCWYWNLSCAPCHEVVSQIVDLSPSVLAQTNSGDCPFGLCW